MISKFATKVETPVNRTPIIRCAGTCQQNTRHTFKRKRKTTTCYAIREASHEVHQYETNQPFDELIFACRTCAGERRYGIEA